MVYSGKYKAGTRWNSRFNGGTFTVVDEFDASGRMLVVWDSNRNYMANVWRHDLRHLILVPIEKRCGCRRGTRRCLLKEHDGSILAHRVRLTDAEEKAGKGTRGFYGWNTGRIYPVAKAPTP